MRPSTAVELLKFPEVLALAPDGTSPIVVTDMSANILPRGFPVKNFSVIFFGVERSPEPVSPSSSLAVLP